MSITQPRLVRLGAARPVDAAPDRQRRERCDRLTVALLLIAVAYACVAQGAFYGDQFRRLLALVALCAVPAGWSIVHHRNTNAAVARVAVVLGAWTALTAATAGHVRDALPALGLLGAVVAVGLAARGAREAREQLVAGLLIAGAGVALTGWAGVVFRVEPLAHVDQGLWRAASTLTYANATAALLAALGLVGLARAGRRGAGAGPRLVAFVLLAGLGATMSRAGLGAFLVGLVVLVGVGGWRTVLPVTVRVGLGAAVATAGVVAVAPSQLPARPALATAAFLLGAAVASSTFRLTRRWAPVAAVLAVVCLIAAAPVVGRAAARVAPARVTASSEDRAGEWRVTMDAVRHHPLLGVGPGRLDLTWVDRQANVLHAEFTHNEFLQLAAEQGGVAVLLVVGALLLVGRALVRRREPLGEQWLRTGALAALVAFSLHSAFDFTWHVPLIPIVMAALVGAALPYGGRS